MKITALVVVTVCASVAIGGTIMAFFYAVDYLGRIAKALEAQNRLHASWCSSQETPFS